MIGETRKITHLVWCNGKLISKHRSFYLAQTAVEKWLKMGRIDNNYLIESKELK